MAKKGRPKLWENCSKEEQEIVTEIEENYIQLKKDYEKGNLSKRKFNNQREKLLKKLDDTEAKYSDNIARKKE